MEARHGRGRALPRDQESRNKQDLQDKGIGRATKAKSPRSPTDENTDSRERCRMMMMMMMMMMMIMLVNMRWVQVSQKKLLTKLWWSPKIPRTKIEFCGATFSHGLGSAWSHLVSARNDQKRISRDGIFQVWERWQKQGVSVSCDSGGAPWLQHVTICCDTPKEPFWWEDSGKFLGPSFGCFFYYLMIRPFHLK